MMIKIGNSSAIDVQTITHVRCREYTEKVVVLKGFWRNTYKDEQKYSVIVTYTDHKGIEDCTYTYGVQSSKRAEEVMKEILQQLRELELVSMTATLEDAIRKT